MGRFLGMFMLLTSLALVCPGCDSDGDDSGPLLNLSGDTPGGDAGPPGEPPADRGNGQSCFIDDECADGEACFADDPSVSPAGRCAALREEGGVCVFGTQCGAGLFCAKDQSTGENTCQPFPSDCPSPPTCDCALSVCARLGGSSCSVGVLDDPASSITVSCAGGVGSSELMDAGVDAMVGDEIETVELPLVVDDHFTERIRVTGEQGFLDEIPCPLRPNTVGECHRFTWRWNRGADGVNGYVWALPGSTSNMLLPVRIVPSARRVRFSAWGVQGPRVTFAVLYVNAAGEDGLATTDLIELSWEPTEYVIDLSGHDHEVFYSGFSWFGSLRDQATEAAGIRIDNIRWE